MNRIIEADFFPPPFEATKVKPRILIIDNNRDFTHSAKLMLERTGGYSVLEENEPARAHQEVKDHPDDRQEDDQDDPQNLRAAVRAAFQETQP